MEINEAKVRLIFIYLGGERKFVLKSAIMLFVTNPESVCRVTKPNQGLSLGGRKSLRKSWFKNMISDILVDQL